MFFKLNSLKTTSAAIYIAKKDIVAVKAERPSQDKKR
jgi:hypothetical protein